MSLNIILVLIAFALVLWFTSSIVHREPKFAMRINIPIALCVLGFSIISFLYFFFVPAINCLLASVLMMLSIIRLNAKDMKLN